MFDEYFSTMEQNHRWLLLNKQTQHKIHVFKSKTNVGRRATADIICYSDKISRNQAYFTLDADGDLYVHDNASVNGTFLNGDVIEPNKLHKLKMLDEVGFGLHSKMAINEGLKYIYDVVDLKLKEDVTIPNTETSTTNNVQVLNPVVMLTDIKLETPNKPEVQNSTAKDHKGYTIEDSVIVVDGSDDSDDDLGPCSQLLSKRNTTSSQDETGMGDSIFFEVKQELQDMEEGAVGSVVYVDDEFAHDPVSSSDLLALFESSMREDNEIVPQENPTKKTNHVTLNDKCVTKDGETNSAANKYVIPPIIPPHFELPKSRKRRGKTECSPVKSKRSKSTDVATKPSTKPKSIFENIELKDKLKAVAMREKAKPQKPGNLKVSPPAPAKVKVSESRGNFLTKPLEVKLNLAKKTNPERDFRVPSTSTNLPSTSTASTSKCQNKNELIAISNKNFQLSKTHENLQDILLQFLNWNPEWLNERKFNDTLPPINQKPLVKLLNSFKSYEEYYSIILPHRIVELWYFFCKEYDLHLDRKKSIHLEKCTNNGKFIELKCFVCISKQDSDRGFHVKEEDVGFLDVTFENNEKHRGVYFGCVSSVKKTVLRNNSAIHHKVTLVDGKVPHAVIDFTVLMKASRNIKCFKKTLEMHVFTNMVSTWRVFNSIKHLKNSLLCDHILKPDLQKYLQLLDKRNLNTLNLDSTLNYSQKCAVAEATRLCMGSTPGIFLIQGPPGTGKSTVIVNIVKQILLANNQTASNQCILLVAPTNTAIDELLVKLIALKFKTTAEDRKKLKIVRFGRDSSIGAAVKTYSLNELAKANLIQNCLQKFAENPELIKIQSAITTLKSQLVQNPQTEVELNAKKELLMNKCKELYGRSYMSELNSVERWVLGGAKIICTTLSSCVGMRMVEVFSNSTKISCCIVDEATYSKEQDTFIPLTLGISKLVLIGDPKQLPGVTFSKEAKELGHDNSLFARLMANFTGAPKDPIRMLNVQYRMHPEICNFPNQTFYNGLLKTDPSVLKRKNPISNYLRPYLVFQMENDLKNINQQQEYQNDSESKFILTLVQAIVGVLPKSHKIYIGIITPYNMQRERILRIFQNNNFSRIFKIHIALRLLTLWIPLKGESCKNKVDERFRAIYFLHEVLNQFRLLQKHDVMGVATNVKISVNTVDSFQGQEQDIIILSSVRTFSNNFLADNQRLNVSLTRAKYALYVIGTENLFQTCEIFGKLQRNSKSRNLLKYICLSTTVPHLTKLIKRS